MPVYSVLWMLLLTITSHLGKVIWLVFETLFLFQHGGTQHGLRNAR